MSDIAIKVENLSKLYQLGSIGTGTLRNDLQRWWAYAKGKEDPFTKIGGINDYTKKVDSEFVWALKDIDFEVKKGEVLGIIGRNGAGKSTLLKILSKITSATTGQIKVNGRIASLLEVGTGFHPELTGRENIFMNGAILGMRKWEIQKKLEEIIDFSGVETYIDTPVKRYSSGMYVRLAFAVAAFLEPEILIVDEVLAVGDSEFQKKCLGRMKDVSVNDGRTVLFVSHNVAAIHGLCTESLVLKHGKLEFIGKTKDALDLYIDKKSLGDGFFINNATQEKKINSKIKFHKIEILDSFNKPSGNLKFGETFTVRMVLECAFDFSGCIFGFSFITKEGVEIQGTSAPDTLGIIQLEKGLNQYECFIHHNPLIPGNYFLRAAVFSKDEVFDHIDEALTFNIHSVNSTGDTLPFQHYVGHIYIKYAWNKINTVD